MKRFAFVSLLILMASICFAIPRGTTQELLPSGNAVYDVAPRVDPQILRDLGQKPVSKLPGRDWILSDSLSLNTIVRAGHQIGGRFYSPTRTFYPFASNGDLGMDAIEAIAKAPRWLETELSNVLRQLSTEDQQRWAAILLAANDPYIDEIAFSIAHSSVAFLSSHLANPQLFVENAQQIYAIDADLQYVQVQDYGTSETDPNYYSSTTYTKRDAAGNLQSVSVPKEIYYWYIVHPKLTDEIPAYIDPAIVENNSNHNNNIALPPTGKFWRSFLYEVQEESYPVLRDTLMQVQSLFNNDGSPGDAIRTLQWWINQTMSFTSNSERPHQPVRIYRKHFGRCGEYADYSSALARTALIPCTSILSMSGDHTWNEFWDEGWIQWEPVNGYINIPLVYENGWGKVFGSVFEIRSDGYLNPVTQRYSEGIATLTLQVLDAAGASVDGARVILAIFSGTYMVDMVGFTDNSGIVVFPVGEANSYYARVESAIGIHPPVAGTYTELIQNAVDGGDYGFQINLSNVKPQIQSTTIPLPDDNLEDYRMAISYSVPSYYIHGRSTWDDIASTGTFGSFYYAVDQPAELTLYLTDADNIIFLQEMGICEAFAWQPNSSSGNMLFDVPVGMDYYMFLDGSNYLGNAAKISGMMLYERSSLDIADETMPSISPILHQSYPNPFTPHTSIAFNLPKQTALKLEVYNLKGQKVRELFSGSLAAGDQQRLWDGKDDNGKSLAAGIYLYRLSSDSGSWVRKCLYVK